jgi:hypothetical protein
MVRSIETDENASSIDGSTGTATGVHSATCDSTLSFSEIQSISISPNTNTEDLTQEAKHEIEELKAKLSLLVKTYVPIRNPV